MQRRIKISSCFLLYSRYLKQQDWTFKKTSKMYLVTVTYNAMSIRKSCYIYSLDAIMIYNLKRCKMEIEIVNTLCDETCKVFINILLLFIAIYLFNSISKMHIYRSIHAHL